MKSIFLTILIILGFSNYAQITAEKSKEVANVVLTSYVSQQMDNMPAAARSMLENKLSQIVTQNGMGSSDINERFILTANIIVLSKDITPTAPPMQALELGISLYIGDGIEGTKFASFSTTVKGAGENETKAYISALKTLKTNDPRYQAFIERGKSKIVEYYNSKCDFIIKDAQSLGSQSQYDEAIYKLSSVPEVCKVCYDKCIDAVAPIYKLQIDKACRVSLADATNSWNSNQNASGALEASEYLAQIDPNASCFKEAQAFSNKIAKRIFENEKKEWDFKMKEYQDDLDLRKQTIRAARDIGIAYGKGQPKTVYRVYGWW
ncbi:hypothetical protein [Flavobacterium algicola]|uniref:hypothetical protein n=1 Tax=Flavobacterium algicola TaxID=556529 RepID=UPI001EFE2807|nr:hypothetical protein [Flavobacterium algicola]MCG9791163.1 hypothetical protein [Flavobacterium algicola]